MKAHIVLGLLLASLAWCLAAMAYMLCNLDRRSMPFLVRFGPVGAILLFLLAGYLRQS